VAAEKYSKNFTPSGVFAGAASVAFVDDHEVKEVGREYAELK
jgi:hypothetical protein